MLLEDELRHRKHPRHDTDDPMLLPSGPFVFAAYDPSSKYKRHYHGLRLPTRRQLELFVHRFDNSKKTAVVVAMTLKDYQGEVNPEVELKLSGAEERAQMMQLTKKYNSRRELGVLCDRH